MPATSSSIHTALKALSENRPLTKDEAEAAFASLMDGQASEIETAGFLMGLAARGESVEELTAGARVLRERALRIEAPANAVDTCGTGGDGRNTLNISTAAALVVAGCGVPVAKHGNRAASSKSGSSQVLEALGVTLEVEPETVTRALAEAGIGFLMAPRHHTAMGHVAPVRAALGVRTIFNRLGPLANPAGTKRQLLGVASATWLVPMSEVLRNLGTERAWVVHGSDGLDELTVTGPSHVAALEAGAIEPFEITPEDAGLERHTLNALVGGSPEENAGALRALLDGAGKTAEASDRERAYRDIVILNAAAALLVAGAASDLLDGAGQAAKALDTGTAAKALETLVRVTGRAKDMSGASERQHP